MTEAAAHGPFGIGTVLVAGARALFGRPGVYLPLALIIYAPVVAVFLLIPPSDPSALFYDITSIDSIVLLFCSCTMSLAATVVVVAEVRGRRLSVVQVFLALIPRLGVMAVTCGLVTVIFFTFVAATMFSPVISVPLILFIPYLATTVVLWVAIPAVAVERIGPLTSLNRSRVLTKGHRWSVFGLVLIIDVVHVGIVLVFELFVLPVFGFQIPVVFFVLYFLFEAFLYMIYSVVAAYSYVYLKISKDGPDIDDLVRVFA